MVFWGVVFMIYCCASALANPLGACGSAGASLYEPNGGTCGFGGADSVAFPNTPFTAAVNVLLARNGTECGECYLVTGPEGSVTVMVTDYCPPTSGNCKRTHMHFMLSRQAWNAAVGPDRGTLYDLGFKRVSCDTVHGPVRLLINTPSDKWYFNFLVFNFKVGIRYVEIKGATWDSWELLSPRGNSIYRWSERERPMTFPMVVRVTSVVGERTNCLVADITPGTVFNFTSQFSEPPAGFAGTSAKACGMPRADASIYNGTLGYGWNENAFGVLNKTLIDATAPYAGLPSFYVTLDPYGGVEFSRPGGFNTTFFTHFIFAARASQNLSLDIYFGGNEQTTLTGIGMSWGVFQVSFATLQASQIEETITLRNAAGQETQFWLADVQLFSATAAPPPPTMGQLFPVGPSIVDLDYTIYDNSTRPPIEPPVSAAAGAWISNLFTIIVLAFVVIM